MVDVEVTDEEVGMVGALWRWWSAWWREAESSPDETSQVKAGVTTGGGDDEVRWVPVYVAANRLEAEVVRGRLESEEIPAVLRGEALGSVYGLTHGPLAQVEVLVPEELLERAEQVLDTVAVEDGDEA